MNVPYEEATGPQEVTKVNASDIMCSYLRPLWYGSRRATTPAAVAIKDPETLAK